LGSNVKNSDESIGVIGTGQPEGNPQDMDQDINTHENLSKKE
jgi:hypothetical protein